MDRLSSLLCFSRSEDGNQYLGKTMGDNRRAIRLPLLRKVDSNVAKLILPATVRAKTSIIQYFDA